VTGRLLNHAKKLQQLFHATPGLAAVLSGSSLPSAALQLAARLNRLNDAHAAAKVGAVLTAMEHACSSRHKQANNDSGTYLKRSYDGGCALWGH